MAEPKCGTGRLPERVLLSSSSSGGDLRLFFSAAEQKKPSDNIDLTEDEILQVVGSSAPPAHGSGHALKPGEGCSRPFGASADGGASWSLAAAAPGSDKPVWDTGEKVLYNGTSSKKEWVLVTVTSTEMIRGFRVYHVQGECAPKKVANWAAFERELKDAPPPMAGNATDQDAAAPEQEQQQPQTRLCAKKGRWARGKKTAPRKRPAPCSPSRSKVKKVVWTPEKQDKYSSAASAAKCAYSREMARSGDKAKAANKSRLRYKDWKDENPTKDNKRPLDRFISIRMGELRAADPTLRTMQAISLARAEWKDQKKKTIAKDLATPEKTDNKIRRWGRGKAARPLISRSSKDMRKSHRIIGKQKRLAVPASGGAAAAHGTASSSFETPRKEPRTAAAALAQPQRAQGWVESSEANNYPAVRGASAAELPKKDDPRIQAMDREALILLAQVSPASKGPPAAASGPASDEPAVPGSIAASDEAAAAHGTAAATSADAFEQLLAGIEF